MAWNWGVSLITFAFGLGFGVAIAYFLLPRNNRIQELEEELAASKASNEEYRGKVSQHFQKTAELFQDMTDRYRAVYQHMADSAQALCENHPPALQLDIVDRRQLPAGERVGGEDTGADAAVKAAAPGQMADQTPADSDDEYLGDAPHVPELDEDERIGADRRDQAARGTARH